MAATPSQASSFTVAFTLNSALLPNDPTFPGLTQAELRAITKEVMERELRGRGFANTAVVVT